MVKIKKIIKNIMLISWNLIKLIIVLPLLIVFIVLELIDIIKEE